jgi:excisionase family DNA binding protein
MRTKPTMTTTRRLETTTVSKHGLRNMAVQPGTVATRPAPAAVADDSGVPEVDALQLLNDPRLKGELAAALFGLIKQPTCTVEEAARIWRVCVETVRRDIRKGALRAYRLPGGSLRILRADIVAYGRPQE